MPLELPQTPLSKIPLQLHYFRMNNMNKTTREAKVLVGLFFASLLFSCVECDAAKDKEECTQQLVGLATCLPYVGGNAKSPTPDCCNGLKQVLKTNKKCLCVIVNDRNDPDLGLDINVTLALGLPTVCNTPSNITKCPELLHLPPNSAEAQVFYQFAHYSSNTATSHASTPVSGGKSYNSGLPKTPGSGQQNNNGSELGKGWLKLRAIAIWAFVWCSISNLIM